MTAFFCSTPYQVINAIQIKENICCDENVDIYILNHFNNSQVVYEALKDLKIFDNVIFLEIKDFTLSFENKKFFTLIRKIYVYLRYRNIVKEFTKNDNIYSNIYFSYPDFIIKLATMNYKKQNNKLKIYMFEDGTYAYNHANRKNTFIKIILNRLFGFGDCTENYDAFLVYNKKLNLLKAKNNVIEIPSIDLANYSLIEKYNKIFNYNSNNKINEKYIFFDSPDPVEEINRKAKEVLEVIAESVQKRNIMVKIHPRYSNEMYKEFSVYTDSSVPWEVICMNNNIENKILISTFSTACFSPKLIFNKEPIVILLYKLLKLHEDGTVSEDGVNFVNSVKNLYKNSNKIYIPEDIDELKEILARLDENIQIE